MLSFSGSLRIFVLVEPCDMRKGFNGLYGMVSTSFGEDPRSGALFVFSNRRHTRIKILYWDGSGLWVLTKRLERGSFSGPPVIAGERAKLKLTPEAFAMLTDGVDLRGAKEAAWILVQIGHLYRIEAQLRKQRAGVVLRDANRSSQSRPIIQRIRQALERWQSTRRFLPQSSIGKAISYALGQWESLEVYLQDAQIEIDNNLVENAIRPTALGK
jgi:transposase